MGKGGFVSKKEFRGLDYDKIKEEYINLSDDELENMTYILIGKSQRAKENKDVFKIVEYMVRLIMINEIIKDNEEMCL